MQLQADGRWPLWVPPVDAARPITDGYGHIACFVCPSALEGLRGLSAGAGAEVRRDHGDSRASNREIVLRLYDQLQACEIRYDHAPWEPAAGQRLRDPAWALSVQESATCVDFAVLFAAMCLREWVAPYLVLLRSRDRWRRAAHVMVALDLDRDRGKLPTAFPLASCDPEPCAGVERVRGPLDLAQDPAVMLIDCTLASAGGRDLAAAVQQGTEMVLSEVYDDVHLVDVAVRHVEGDPPLGAPTAVRASLRRRLPGPRHVLRPFESRQEVVNGLREATGRVALVGDSGTGKSELARDAAARVDHGLGWVLTATNRATLIASLAEAELVERGWGLDVLDTVDREAFARAALTRLAQAPAAWAVVVDNANCKPSELRGWLPTPDAGAGQLVIVTSTFAEWLGEGGTVLPVRRLEPRELEEQLEDPRLIELAAGRPLLMHAFMDAGRHLGLEARALADRLDHGEPADDTAAPRLLWELLRHELSPDAVDGAVALAWLLPDGTPEAVLAAAGIATDEALPELLDAGLISLGEGTTGSNVSMHRLFGGAIRGQLHGTAGEREAVVALLANTAVRELLLIGGDKAVTQQLAASLLPEGVQTDAHERDRPLGLALWALAAMQEMHEEVKISAATYSLATGFLDEAVAEDRALIADCLHGQAREVNQFPAGDVKALARAREWVREAIALRGPADLAGVSKHRALEGLLMQRHARDALPFASEAQVAELREALEILEQSWSDRRQAAGADARLVDRAYFNRAGVRVDLAQRVPQQAGELLAVAESVYRDTLAFRVRVHRDPHPHTAASHAGLATTLYYQALLLDPPDRDTRLLEATEEASVALEQRRHTDGGRDGGDVAKSAAVLAKIAIARMHRAQGLKGDQELAKLLLEISRELPRT
jgi:hypothetical protein